MGAILDHGLTVVETDRPQLVSSEDEPDRVLLVNSARQRPDQMSPALQRVVGRLNLKGGSAPLKVAAFQSAV